MPKIIIFQDDKILAGMYATKFRLSGFEVVWFEHPDKKVEKQVKKVNPDYILMNIIMPVMDGFDATRKLKAAPETASIPLAFLTNQGQPEEVKRGIALGAVDYFVMAKYIPDEIVQAGLDYLKDPVRYKRHTPKKLYIYPRPK